MKELNFKNLNELELVFPTPEYKNQVEINNIKNK